MSQVGPTGITTSNSWLRAGPLKNLSPMFEGAVQTLPDLWQRGAVPTTLWQRTFSDTHPDLPLTQLHAIHLSRVTSYRRTFAHP